MLTPLCSSEDFTAAKESFEAIEAERSAASLTSALFRNVKNKLFSPAKLAVKLKEIA